MWAREVGLCGETEEAEREGRREEGRTKWTTVRENVNSSHHARNSSVVYDETFRVELLFVCFWNCACLRRGKVVVVSVMPGLLSVSPSLLPPLFFLLHNGKKWERNSELQAVAYWLTELVSLLLVLMDGLAEDLMQALCIKPEQINKMK